MKRARRETATRDETENRTATYVRALYWKAAQ